MNKEKKIKILNKVLGVSLILSLIFVFLEITNYWHNFIWIPCFAVLLLSAQYKSIVVNKNG